MVVVARLTSTDFVGKTAAFPQALDNQWTPISLLKMLKNTGAAPGEWSEDLYRTAYAELIRSLIDTRHAIVNRAFIYNNPAINKLYTGNSIESDKGRCDFTQLLSSRALVPFYLNEDDPHEFPSSFSVTNEHAVRESFLALLKNDAEFPMLRLSWDHEENKRYISAMNRHYHETMRGLWGLSPRALSEDLGVPDVQISALFERLRDVDRFVSDHCDPHQQKFVTREELYQEFVCQRGSKVSDKYYDFSKPFSSEIKQLIDLCYNINGADMFQLFAISPRDNLSRDTLQELKQGQKRPAFDLEQTRRILNNLFYEANIKSIPMPALNVLSIADVLSIRRTDAFSLFHDGMEQILGGNYDIFDLDDNYIADVMMLYGDLATQVSAKASEKAFENWTSDVFLIIETLKSNMKIKIPLNLKLIGIPIHVEIGVDLSDILIPGDTLVAKLALGGAGWVGRRLGHAISLGSQYLLFQKRLTDVRTEMQELLKLLKDETGREIQFHGRTPQILDGTIERE